MAATSPSSTVTIYGSFGPNTQTELESVFLLKEGLGTPAQTVAGGSVTFTNQIIAPAGISISGIGLSGANNILLATGANNLTGNGNNQGNATALTAAINVISTCNANNNAFVLPKSVAGMSVEVINTTGNQALVFPAANDAIDGGAANASYSVGANNGVTLAVAAAGNWWPVNFEPSGSNNITLAGNSGNSQNYANGVLLTGTVNVIATANANNNSAILPAAEPGATMLVVNVSGVSVSIFPKQTTDQVQLGGANTAYSLANNNTVLLAAGATGNWFAIHGS